MNKRQTNLGMLSVMQGRQIDGLDYCSIKSMKLSRVMKKGNDITIVFDTTLDTNKLNIKKSKWSFTFIDGVSEDVATNDFFTSICRNIKE